MGERKRVFTARGGERKKSLTGRPLAEGKKKTEVAGAGKRRGWKSIGSPLKRRKRSCPPTTRGEVK